MRTVGVEEELLLVDARSGEPVAVADALLRRDPGSGPEVDAELQQQQIETNTEPTESLTELAHRVVTARATVDRLAGESGARVAALATSPVPVSPEVTAKPRYLTMLHAFGLTTAEQLTCGCHVHVSVESPEEGVGVLDRIRVWLPTLLALTANSPFWQGRDSGYASYRTQVWSRLPTAGPTDPFGSAVGYTTLVDALLAAQVSLDQGMIYFDARLSAHYPTVEIRVADVCLDARDTVLVAALARALVETAARAWAAGTPAPVAATEVLRAASWRASRSGLAGELVDPASGTPRPAAEVAAALVAHVGPALDDHGDRGPVEEALARVLSRGTGAAVQRRLFQRSRSLHRLVLDAADYSTGQSGNAG